MPVVDDPDGRSARLVTDWLFLLLRFAVTRDDRDRASAEAFARQLDGIGQYRSDAPGFFERTSQEVCTAVVESENPHSLAVLKRHAQRIENLRLKQCFCLAAGIDQSQQKSSSPTGRRRPREDLWRGLPSRCVVQTVPER